jgi:Uma2 family endonuclease
VKKEEAMKPQPPAQAEQPEGEFGYRLEKRIRADGSVEYEQVPFTVEDVLHPEPDDVFPVRPQHAIDCRYLVSVFRVRAAAELASVPIIYVSDDHSVDWGVHGQRNTSPDVALFAGLRQEVSPLEGTFDLKASGGRCLLVVEVVSPDRRRENDVVHKVREYHAAGVPLYVIVDQEKEDSPRHVRALRYRPTGYEELPSDPQGVLLPPLQLRLGLKDGRVVCHDVRTGRELGDYERISQELEEADRRIAEQDLAIEQAIGKTREEREAREAAEKLAREQKEALDAAEKLAREQKEAREAAEKLAREQKEGREAAEERIRQLEAALQALKPSS